jgi:ABC-type transport system involved in cytochrome c biogenesis permease subunit
MIVCGCGAVLLAVASANALLAGRRFGMGDGAAQVLDRLLNGAWAAGLVFIATGILMGGLWAEGAWGRFWGWDPKENGALILLLWLALALHARRAGWVRAGGFAALAALGGVALAWSWMGTNLLGAGLHAYALAGAGGRFVGAYVILQLAWVVLFRPGVAKRSGEIIRGSDGGKE